MYKIFLYFILLFTVSSCSLSNSENATTIELNDKENLPVYISNHYRNIKPNSEIQQITIANADWINEFYEEDKYNPIWINDSLELNDNGITFIQLLSTSYNYGLDTNFYNGIELKQLSNKLNKIKDKNEKYNLAAELEILLTNSYFLIGKELNYGIVQKDSSILVSNILRKEFDIDLPNYLLNSYKTDSITAILLMLQPQHIEYKKLQKQLEKYLKTASLIGRAHV